VRSSWLVDVTWQGDDVERFVQVKSVGNDIGDVIGRYLERARKKGGGRSALDDIVEIMADRVVIIKTRGTCKFRYGVQQQIRVDQIPLTTSV